MDIDKRLALVEKRLVDLEEEKKNLLHEIESLKKEKSIADKNHSSQKFDIKKQFSEDEKIALFRSLFKGRQDVFPKRFESQKTGRSGYQPACANEWIPVVCQKPKIKCSECQNKKYIPVDDQIVKSHLMGKDIKKSSYQDFTIGIYPLLQNEACWFLAADFDKEKWQEDVSAYLETCQKYNIPAALERSRSGNGGHVWIFFEEPIPASMARKLGSFILTETMDKRPELGLDSYDRFFPNQDTMPQGGFGNLIALPLQNKPRKQGNSVFIDDNFNPYDDQWYFLSSMERMSYSKVETIVDEAIRQDKVIGVKFAFTEEDEDQPWITSPSRKKKQNKIPEPLPKELKLTLGSQIFIEKESLTPVLMNRLIRLAAFQNPEFVCSQNLSDKWP